MIHDRWLAPFLPTVPAEAFIKQQKIRLLTELALIVIILSIALDISHLLTSPIYKQHWVRYILLVLILFLNRINLYRPAAMLAVAFVPIVVFSQFFSDTAHVSASLLNYLVVGLLVSSLLLSLRETAVATFLMIASILLTPILLPNFITSFNQIINPLALLIINSILLSIFMRQRNVIETHRQTALQQSQEQLQMTLNAAKMGTWHWDMLTDKVTWSDRTLEIFRLTSDTFDFDYPSYINATHPDDRDRVEAVVQNAVAQKIDDYDIEHRIIWPDGTLRWIHAKGSVHCDKQGQPIALLGLVNDITSYHQTMNALRYSEERFRALAENVPGVIYLCRNNRSRDMLYLNDMVESLTGYPKEMFLNGELNFTDLYHPDDLDIVYDPVEEALAQHKSFSLSYRIKHKNGEWRWIEETGIGIQQDDGEWLLEGFLIDVTERKEVEIALQSSEEMHRLLLASIQTPVLSLTEEMDILFCNKAYATMTNRSIEMLEGHNLVSIFPNFIQRESYKAYRAALETGESQSVEGWAFDTYWRANVYRTPWGILALSEDMTEQQQMQEIREQLIEELAAKNQELERFTYTVSHDLKSPLVTVKGFMGFLEQDALAGDTDRVRNDIDHINTAVDRMQNLLNDLLELSRIGRLINPPQNVTFRELIQEALGAVAGQLAKHNVEVSIKPDMPIVHGDRPRLVQMLQNLLDNAIKYMGDQPNPAIAIGYEKQGEEIVFYVQDNGIGIDPQYQEKAFDLFERLSRPGEGTGIGLAIVKRIVEVHNSRIWIESNGKQGAIFYFTLPLANEMDS